MSIQPSIDAPRFRVAIPARYDSSRLPGKPLRLLAGRPMIEHVYRRASASGAAEVVIATDDERIRAAAAGFGADVCMTSRDHPTGTDRLAELAVRRGWADDDIIVNLQGDEPLMPPVLLRQVAAGLAQHAEAGIATLCTPLYDQAEIDNPNIVKVVFDAQGYALYFSRAPIPYRRQGGASVTAADGNALYWRHFGIYAYRISVLRRYPELASAPAEQAELLEQLRALWHGIRIHVQPALREPPASVDTEADLDHVTALFEGER